MGTAASTVLDDGTHVGDAAFAQAVSRMHRMFPACDDEFAQLSSAVNSHGRESTEFKLAAQLLSACQRRREVQFHTITTACGPAQEAFRVCTREAGAGNEHRCLPVLHAFLNCSESALKGQSDAPR